MITSNLNNNITDACSVGLIVKFLRYNIKIIIIIYLCIYIYHI